MRSPVRIRVAAPDTPDTRKSVGALAFYGDFCFPFFLCFGTALSPAQRCRELLLTMSTRAFCVAKIRAAYPTVDQQACLLGASVGIFIVDEYPVGHPLSTQKRGVLQALRPRFSSFYFLILFCILALYFFLRLHISVTHHQTDRQDPRLPRH